MRVINLLLISTLAFAQGDALIQGLEAFHHGKYPEAERRFRDVLKTSEDARARAFLAMTLAATGRCAAAEPDLVKAWRGGATDLRRMAGLALVQCHIAAGRLDEAASALVVLKTAYPADDDVLYETARLQMRAWNDTIYQLYQKNPSSFRVNQLSGEILETQGQYAEAVAEYRKAIVKNPNALNLHFRLARALLMSSHAPETLDAATAELEAELAMNPTDAIAMYQEAQILLTKQKSAEASVLLERALQNKPDFPEALIALGKIRTDEKRSDEAIRMLVKAIQLMPKSEAAHYGLMMAYRNAGRLADAKREKAELDKLQKAPEGEFTEFLKKLGEKPHEEK